MNKTAEKSVLDELHRLLDTVDVSGNTDVSDITRPDLSSLGQTLYDVLSRSRQLTDRYAHYFKPDPKAFHSNYCDRCGLYITDAIHIRG